MLGHDVMCSEFLWCVLVIYQWFSLFLPHFLTCGAPAGIPKGLMSPATMNGFDHHARLICPFLDLDIVAFH